MKTENGGWSFTRGHQHKNSDSSNHPGLFDTILMRALKTEGNRTGMHGFGYQETLHKEYLEKIYGWAVNKVGDPGIVVLRLLSSG
jgi:hypothetical protein